MGINILGVVYSCYNVSVILMYSVFDLYSLLNYSFKV